MLKKIIVVSLLAIGLLFGCSCAEKKAAAPEAKKVTIVDETGRSVEVPCPPQRIVSINSYVSELLCAFGAEDKIVARSELCTFPPKLKEKLSLGKSWVTPNLELLLAQKPDLVIADPCLKAEVREKIEQAGIPVLLFKAYETDGVLLTIKSLGLILDQKDKAEELAALITRHQEMVQKRLERLEPEEKPPVYFEDGRGAYYTAAAGTATHKRVEDAGGVNIAAGEPVKFPAVNAEWVLEKNPSLIVKEVYPGWLGVEIPTEEVMAQVRTEILNRPGLKKLKSVQEGRVYVICSKVLTGPRSVVGLISLARWFHPELFADVDPVVVHREMLQKFYGLELEGVWSYPDSRGSR